MRLGMPALPSLSFLIACCLTVFWVAPASADEKDRGVTLVLENDVISGTDRHYTNGFQLSYLFPQSDLSGFFDKLGQKTAGQLGGAVTYFKISVGQSIFTPEDISTPAPLPDQHPYAGWLYTNLTYFAERKSVLDTFSLDLGMIGPAAQGETVQREFHKLIDGQDPKGWDNQLENEFGLTASIERKWRARPVSLGPLDFDFTPNVGVSLGNVLTQGKGGITLRLGEDLMRDFGPPRVRPALTGSGAFRPSGQFSWYFFGGAEGRAIARNIFLDGNTFRDSLSVDKRHFVADFQVGVVVQGGPVQISYTWVARTEEFKTQEDNQQFGAIALSYAW